MSRDIKTNSGFNGCNDCNSILRSQMVPRDLSKFGVEKLADLLKKDDGDYNNYYVYVYVDKEDESPSNGFKATSSDVNTKGVRVSLGELLKTASQVDWKVDPPAPEPELKGVYGEGNEDPEPTTDYRAIKNRPNVWTPDVRLTKGNRIKKNIKLNAEGEEVYVVGHSVGGLRAGEELKVGELEGASAIEILDLIMNGGEGIYNVAFGMIDHLDKITKDWIAENVVKEGDKQIDRSTLLTKGYTGCPLFNNTGVDEEGNPRLPLYYVMAIPYSATLDLTLTGIKYAVKFWQEGNEDMKFTLQLEHKDVVIPVDNVDEKFRLYYPAAPIKHDSTKPGQKLYFNYTFEDTTPRAIDEEEESK